MLQRPRMRHRIPAQTGYGFFLNNGQYLRVVTPTGGRWPISLLSAKTMLHWLSNGRTFDYNGTIYLTQGHVLYSNRSEPMLTIVADDVGGTISSMRPAVGRCSASSTASGRLTRTAWTILPRRWRCTVSALI